MKRYKTILFSNLDLDRIKRLCKTRGGESATNFIRSAALDKLKVCECEERWIGYMKNKIKKQL